MGIQPAPGQLRPREDTTFLAESTPVSLSDGSRRPFTGPQWQSPVLTCLSDGDARKTPLCWSKLVFGSPKKCYRPTKTNLFGIFKTFPPKGHMGQEHVHAVTLHLPHVASCGAPFRPSSAPHFSLSKSGPSAVPRPILGPALKPGDILAPANVARDPPDSEVSSQPFWGSNSSQLSAC